MKAKDPVIYQLCDSRQSQNLLTSVSHSVNADNVTHSSELLKVTQSSIDAQLHIFWFCHHKATNFMRTNSYSSSYVSSMLLQALYQLFLLITMLGCSDGISISKGRRRQNAMAVSRSTLSRCRGSSYCLSYFTVHRALFHAIFHLEIIVGRQVDVTVSIFFKRGSWEFTEVVCLSWCCAVVC